MSQAAIRKELESKLINWAANYSTPIKLALENVPFVKPTDYSPFIEVYLVPSLVKSTTVDGINRRYIGIFHLNVWTKDGQGAGLSERVLQEMENLFPVVPKSGNVSIEKTPNASRGVASEGWRVTPITINYRYEQ